MHIASFHILSMHVCRCCAILNISFVLFAVARVLCSNLSQSTNPHTHSTHNTTYTHTYTHSGADRQSDSRPPHNTRNNQTNDHHIALTSHILFGSLLLHHLCVFSVCPSKTHYIFDLPPQVPSDSSSPNRASDSCMCMCLYLCVCVRAPVSVCRVLFGVLQRAI